MMKKFLAILIVLFAFGCSGELQKENITEKIKVDTTTEMNVNIQSWDEKQDSLRKLILESKENEMLKTSFVQEMYIRDVVILKNNILHFNIFFDIHGNDCVAPDCYQTELYFNFKFDNKFIFPKTIPFVVHEYGCIENGKNFSDEFQLIEENQKYVIYSCKKQNCSLVLFANNIEYDNYAYYFDNVEYGMINSGSIDEILNSQEEENAIIPYKSWILSTNEYENFLRNN